MSKPLKILLIISLLMFLACLWPARALTSDPTKGDIFLGWMKYAAHVQIRFLNGGHTTYGREQMKDITKELEAGLKCVKEQE